MQSTDTSTTPSKHLKRNYFNIENKGLQPLGEEMRRMKQTWRFRGLRQQMSCVRSCVYSWVRPRWILGQAAPSLAGLCLHLSSAAVISGTAWRGKQSRATLQGEQEAYKRNQIGVYMVNVSIKWPRQLQKWIISHCLLQVGLRYRLSIWEM